MKITKTCVGQVVCLFLIKVLYTYVTVITLAGLSYEGSIGGYYIAYNPNKDVVASLVMLVVAIYYSKRKFEYNTVSVVLHVLFIFYYIPINSAYAIHNLELDFFILSSIYFIWIIVLLGRYEGNLLHRTSEKYESSLNSSLVNAVCFIICMGMIVFKLFYNGLQFSLTIDSEIVYSTRAAFNERLSGINGKLLGYLFALFSNLESTIAPLYLFIALRRKKAGAAIVAIIAILSEYSITSMKGDLFGIVLVIGIYIVYRFGWLDHFREFFSLLFVGIMAFCFIERTIVRVGPIYFLLIRRVFQAPANLNYLYYDYFRGHGKLFLTDSVLGLQRLLPHVYDEHPLKLISDTYFSGMAPSPNTGLFGAAYMQLGIVGIILQPILIFWIVRWADRLLKNYGKGFIAVTAITMVMAMQNVPILRTDFVLSEILVIALLGILPNCKAGMRVKLKSGRNWRIKSLSGFKECV